MNLKCKENFFRGLLFVAMNKSVKPSDESDHQFTPEEGFHQIDARMVFTMGEQPLVVVVYNQTQFKKLHIYSVLYLKSFSAGFCD